MRNIMLGSSLSLLLSTALGLLLVSPSPALAGATISIVNADGAGEGFNDPTPVAPVGGNPGTTRGAQRLIAFQFAADIWGATLDSNVLITIRSNFDPLSCNATQAVLGSAGTLFIFANFPATPPFAGPAFANTWHSSALADKRAGFELNPGQPDISARFNVNLGNVGCLTGIGWYLGLDNNHGSQIDLVTVLLHEFGHGLGFQQFGNLGSGALIGGLPDTYNRNLLDLSNGLLWNQMTNAQRAASAINPRRVVWFGDQVTDEVPGCLAPGTPLLRVNSPAAISGDYAVGTASFGPPVASPGITGGVVQALDPADAAGPTTFDACSPITNAAAVAGKVALVDRGVCGFIVKVKNAQDAGAVAVLVADNVAGGPPAGLGGADPTIIIPSVRITLADGNTIKAQLASGVNVSLLLDLLVRSGADLNDRALLYSPNPVVGGSSISHWDTIAFPNQLMEPNINLDLTHNVSGVDLTLALMRDVGWYPDADVDGLSDSTDNCPGVANPGQEDHEGDGLGDICDLDDDNDGVADVSDSCPLDVPELNLDADGNGCTDTYAGLRAIVGSLNLSSSIVNGMMAKLNLSESAAAGQNQLLWMKLLRAFILQVEGQRGNAIDNATADVLVNYAENLIALGMN
ncbi:MAG TPA: PA domain-containing protein [Candidatus Polarisedimenticolia bacterium]|jgi:hypothetical protein